MTGGRFLRIVAVTTVLQVLFDAVGGGCGGTHIYPAPSALYVLFPT